MNGLPKPGDGRKTTFVFDGDPHCLNSAVGVELFLAALVRRLGMRELDLRTYVVELEVAKRDDPDQDEGGVTGFAVLSTSHIAIHTWPLQRYARMEVDSCRDYSPADVEAGIRVAFDAQHVKATDETASIKPDW